jgi:hypothetical protein
VRGEIMGPGKYIWKHRGISVSSYYDQYHDPPAHPYVTRYALGADVTLIGWVMALWPMVYIAVRAQLSLHVSQPPWSLNRFAWRLCCALIEHVDAVMYVMPRLSGLVRARSQSKLERVNDDCDRAQLNFQ